MNTFDERKQAILTRARTAEACSEQYLRAYGSTNDVELLQVIADNFLWSVRHNVIDLALMTAFPESDRITVGIYLSGHYAHEKGQFVAYGNATVEADGNATVEADGNATVEADGNATVRAYGNATVRAYGNATVEADGNATVEAYGNATVRAYGNATVRADGLSNVYIYNGKEVKLSGYSIARYAPYWGARPTCILVAVSASELIQAELANPVQP